MSRKNKVQGFTLIELIVVFFIIGILSAIALPYLLTQPCKAKQAEARQNTGAMNRAQQAYFLEKNAFAQSIDKLGVGIKTETENFVYSLRAGDKYALNYATPRKGKPNHKSYVGGVFTVPSVKVEPKSANDEIITLAIMCETERATGVPAPDPIYKNGELTCAPGTKDLGR